MTKDDLIRDGVADCNSAKADLAHARPGGQLPISSGPSLLQHGNVHFSKTEALKGTNGRR